MYVYNKRHFNDNTLFFPEFQSRSVSPKFDIYENFKSICT